MTFKCTSSLASSLNGYMYSNCTSLNVAVFILMANHFVPRITLQLLGVKIIPCGVASLFDIQLKQKDWGQSNVLQECKSTHRDIIKQLDLQPL